MSAVLKRLWFSRKGSGPGGERVLRTMFRWRLAGRPPTPAPTFHRMVPVTGDASLPKELRRIQRAVLPVHMRGWPPPMARHGSWLVVARLGRRAAGYLWLVPQVGAQRDRNVEEVAVLAANQGRGIARALMHAAAQWASEQGVGELSITPLDSVWFRSMGFRETAHRWFTATPAEVAEATATRI